ncbi:MAG TPA: DNA-3-methyladenine glycosylase 2 family protein [Chloroflexi bacterium]|nr:DNA-3-methyladenine glycosylase 2 family protein [Chloroflexota bacterium]
MWNRPGARNEIVTPLQSPFTQTVVSLDQKTRTRAEGLSQGVYVRLALSACAPFSLRAIVASHGWARLSPFFLEPQTAALGRIERLGTGRVVELLVREARDGVTVETPDRLDGFEREEVARKVWWMLRLGEDLTPFYEAIRDEPRLAHLEREGLGRILRSPTLFEDVVKVLLTTNTTWDRTVRMVEALVARYGDPLPSDPSRHAFPTPAQLAAAREEDLRAIGIGYRAPHLLDLARRVAGGELDLEQLKDGNVPAPRARRLLRDLPGVGEYATALLMVLLGRYEAIPVDAVARRRVAEEWYGGQPVGREEVERAFERWGRWKGLVYWWWPWPRDEGSEEQETIGEPRSNL